MAKPTNANGSPPANQRWYYTRNHKQKLGPVSTAQLMKLARSGGLLRADMVLPEGTNTWTPAGAIKGLFPTAASRSTGVKRPLSGDFRWTQVAKSKNKGKARRWIVALGATAALVLGGLLAFGVPLVPVGESPVAEHRQEPAGSVSHEAYSLNVPRPTQSHTSPLPAKSPPPKTASDDKPPVAKSLPPKTVSDDKPPVAKSPPPKTASDDKPPVAKSPPPKTASDDKPPVAKSPSPKTATDDKPPGKLQTVVEKFGDGRIQRRFFTRDGKKEGTYEEFHATGKMKCRAFYKADKLSGLYTEYNEKAWKTLAASYKDGKLNGTLTHYDKGLPILSQPFKDGEAIFLKSREKIAATLQAIYGTAKPGPDEDSQRDFALRRLKAYRYLCDVPYQDLTLDSTYNRQAHAAAAICEKLQRLDHQPPNPGLPEADYQLAKLGAARSNLAFNLDTIADSVDAWMDDSNPDGEEMLGHRRWCLNPGMAKTGFGKADQYTAMYAWDNNRKTTPDSNFVCYPPRGLVPTDAFKAEYTWCVCPNRGKLMAPDNNVKVKVSAIDEQFRKVGQPLVLKYQRTDKWPMGMLSGCIMFRPENVEVADGRRYLIEIDGLKNIAGRPVGVLAYPVIFVELPH